MSQKFQQHGLRCEKVTKENRRQSEMEFYKGIHFNEKNEEFPKQCIYCLSRVIKLTKKLPRTFKCSNGHSFDICDYRSSLK